MMTQYYSQYQLEVATTVKNEELNSKLQEVRSLNNNYYLIERTIKVKSGWFSKPKEKTVYTLLYHIGGSECQLVNFDQESDWSINVEVPKSYIMTFFIGYLNGHLHKTKK